jgi:hypothetical protein
LLLWLLHELVFLPHFLVHVEEFGTTSNRGKQKFPIFLSFFSFLCIIIIIFGDFVLS